MTASAVASPAAFAAARRAWPWIALVAAEGAVLAAYFAAGPAEVGEVRYLVYPFVWINAGLWAVWRVRPAPGNRRHQLLGLGVGAGYFILVMAVPGNVGLGDAGAVSVRVGWYAPGWGPLLAVTSPLVRLFLVPFEVLGYAALSYLVYANALRLARGTLSGVLGLVTCVGCTVPVLAPVVGLLGGPASGLATTAYAWSYDVGTLLFLATVGLLVASHEGSLSP